MGKETISLKSVQPSAMKKLFIVPIMVTIVVLITTLFASYPVHAETLEYNSISDTYNYTTLDYDSSSIGSAFDSEESIYDVLDEVAQTVGTFVFVIGLVISLIWCFFGFKAFKVYVGICGFLVGGIIGGLLAVKLYESIGFVAFLLILVGAILGAVLSYKLYKLGLFFTGFLAMLVVFGLITYAISKNSTASIVVGIIFGIIGGIILMVLNKPAIIISTGVQYGLSAGVFLSCIIAHTRLMGVLGIVIAVLGIRFQIKNNNGLFETKAQPVVTDNVQS